MYHARPSRHRLFVDRHPGRDRTPDLRPRVPLTIRDRVALGYYDRPDVTDAVVRRMLQIFNAENN